MAVERLAMCYPALAGGTWGAGHTSIQNNSGLPQGLAGISVAGWGARKPSARAGQRRW